MLAVATFGATDELIADWVHAPADDRPPVDVLIDEVTAVAATVLGLPAATSGATPRRPGPARPS